MASYNNSFSDPPATLQYMDEDLVFQDNYGYEQQGEDIQMENVQNDSLPYGVDNAGINESYNAHDYGGQSPPRDRLGSASSSASYISSRDSLDEVEEREELAMNLSNPNDILDLLPSRNLGKVVLNSTRENKWVMSQPLRHRRSTSGHSNRVIEDCKELDEIVERIIKNSDETDGTVGATLKRRNTIRQMSSGIKVKRKVRNEVVKKVKRKKKEEGTGLFSSIWNSLAHFLRGIKESVEMWANDLALWKKSIKTIEGNFGSSVTSFFLLLRWLLYLNFVVFLLTFGLIVIPEIAYRYGPGIAPEHEQFQPLDLLTGGGWMENSTFFYGSYTNDPASYNIPLAYLLTYAVCYILILVVLIHSISKSYRQYFVTGDKTHGFYSSKIFTGWDYGVTSDGTAKLKQRSIYLELAESLHITHNQKRSLWSSVWLLFVRLFTITLTVLIIGGACFLIVYLYSNDKNLTGDYNLLTELTIPLLVAGYNLVLPYMFTVITSLERYKNPRTSLYMALIRVFIMKVAVLVVLIFFWLRQVNCEAGDLRASCQCWETFAGQEIYKLVIVDFIVQGLAIFVGELFVVLGRKYFCKFLSPPEFNIARNTMDLIQSQAYTWIGMYFSPPLMSLCIIKIILTFYVKKISVLHNCQPSNQPWRASLAKTVFLIILFVFFAICGFSVGYILVQVTPSVTCGPFRGETSPFDIVLSSVEQWSDVFTSILTVLTSPGFIMSVFICIILGIYYFRTVTKGRRKVIKRLKQQITLEGKDKRFLLKRLRAVMENLQVGNKSNMRHKRLGEKHQTDPPAAIQDYDQSMERQQSYNEVSPDYEGHIGYPAITHLNMGTDVVLH